MFSPTMPKLYVFTALTVLHLTTTTDCHRTTHVEISPELNEIKEGLPTRFSCVVKNNNETTLKWHKFDESTGILGHKVRSLRRYNSSHYWSAVMSIRNVSRTDMGVYVCVAKNREGQTIGRQYATLSVLYVDPINTEPVEASVERYSSRVLRCRSPNGNPRPTIGWYRGNRKLVSLENRAMDPVTKQYTIITEVSHAVTAGETSDAIDEYVCRISSCCGIFNITVKLSYFGATTTADPPGIFRVYPQSPYAGATILVPLVFSANNDRNPFYTYCLVPASDTVTVRLEHLNCGLPHVVLLCNQKIDRLAVLCLLDKDSYIF